MSMTPAVTRPGRRTAEHPTGRGLPGRPSSPADHPTPRPPLTVLPRGYRSPRARRRRRRLVAAIGFVAALAGVFALVLVHVQLTTNQLRLVHLQQEADRQQLRHIKLRLEVATLESPARVVDAAQQMGMVSPATITYLTVGSTPAPAPAPGTATQAAPGAPVAAGGTSR
ncbi:MAG: hypothetical protein NVS3B12_11420 [Acidimicrobiales bacterium]